MVTSNKSVDEARQELARLEDEEKQVHAQIQRSCADLEKWRERVYEMLREHIDLQKSLECAQEKMYGLSKSKDEVIASCPQLHAASTQQRQSLPLVESGPEHMFRIMAIITDLILRRRKPTNPEKQELNSLVAQLLDEDSEKLFKQNQQIDVPKLLQSDSMPKDSQQEESLVGRLINFAFLMAKGDYSKDNLNSLSHADADLDQILGLLLNECGEPFRRENIYVLRNCSSNQIDQAFNRFKDLIKASGVEHVNVFFFNSSHGFDSNGDTFAELTERSQVNLTNMLAQLKSLLVLNAQNRYESIYSDVFGLLENCRVKRELAMKQEKVRSQTHTVYSVPCGLAAVHSMRFKNSDNLKIWLQCVRSSLKQRYPDCLQKEIQYRNYDFVQLFAHRTNPGGFYLTAQVDHFQGLKALLRRDFAKMERFLSAFDDANNDGYINFGLSAEELDYFEKAQAVEYVQGKMPIQAQSHNKVLEKYEWQNSGANERFCGELVNGLKCGRGIMIGGVMNILQGNTQFRGDHFVIGNFCNGELSGQGTVIDHTGDRMVFTLNLKGTPCGQLNYMPGSKAPNPWRVDLDKQDDAEGSLKKLVRSKLDNLYVESVDLRERLNTTADAVKKEAKAKALIPKTIIGMRKVTVLNNDQLNYKLQPPWQDLLDHPVFQIELRGLNDFRRFRLIGINQVTFDATAKGKFKMLEERKWIGAEDHYGVNCELVSLRVTMPKGGQVDMPRQIEAKINTSGEMIELRVKKMNGEKYEARASEKFREGMWVKFSLDKNERIVGMFGQNFEYGDKSKCEQNDRLRTCGFMIARFKQENLNPDIAKFEHYFDGLDKRMQDQYKDFPKLMERFTTETNNLSVHFGEPPAYLEDTLAQSKFHTWAKDKQGHFYQGDLHTQTGAKHGRGVYMMTDDLDIAFWRNDQRHGESMTINDLGQKYIDRWQGGKLHGLREVYGLIGTKTTYMYDQHRRHGESITEWPSGNSSRRTYVEGKLHGECVEILSGVVRTSLFSYGERSTHVAIKYPDGQQATATYEWDDKDDNWTLILPDGTRLACRVQDGEVVSQQAKKGGKQQ